MGAFTLADFRTKVLHKLALPSDDAMVPPASLDESINAGLRAMATDYDWPWLQNQRTFVTVAGQQAYTLPDGLGVDPAHVKTLWISHPAFGYGLEVRERLDVERYLLTKGLPTTYSVEGTQIVLAPVPDQVYTLKHQYIRPETPLVVVGNTVLCPDWFSDVIVLYATVAECQRTKDFTMTNNYKSEIAEWKQRMKDNVRQSAGTLKVRTRTDYGTW